MEVKIEKVQQVTPITVPPTKIEVTIYILIQVTNYHIHISIILLKC